MTKLEEVARAIEREFEKREMHKVSSWTPEDWAALSRAAIEALREPTEMQAQIARHYFGLNPFEWTGPPMNHTLLAAYRAMIDAILSESE